MLQRTIVGLAAFAVLFAAVYFGGFIFDAVALIYLMIAQYEMIRIFRKKVPTLPAWPLFVFTLLGYAGLLLRGAEGVFFAQMLCAVMAFGRLVFRPTGSFDEALYCVFALFYPSLLLFGVMLINHLPGFELSRIALLAMFLYPLGADSFAYFVGVLFGKRKLCPSISPNKTVEGFLGGFIGIAVAGAIIYLISRHLFIFEISPAHLLNLGVLCGIIGPIGDLAESALKRSFDVKDSGTLLGGHGGALDRADSWLFCMPLILGYFCLVII